jgi:hypothetical protein
MSELTATCAFGLKYGEACNDCTCNIGASLPSRPDAGSKHFERYVCEASTPERPCGPVVRFDSDGNPTCQQCWENMMPTILHHTSRDGGALGEPTTGVAYPTPETTAPTGPSVSTAAAEAQPVAVGGDWREWPHTNRVHREVGESRAAITANTAPVAPCERCRNMTNALGFFASVIKSGEKWSVECDKMLRAAFDTTPHRESNIGS